MSDTTKTLETLEEEITAINDTHRNLVGLVEKMASTQLALDDAGYSAFSTSVGQAFNDLTNAATCLEQLAHDADLERNRIRNES